LEHCTGIYLVELQQKTKNVISWPVSASRFELRRARIRSKMLAAGQQSAIVTWLVLDHNSGIFEHIHTTILNIV
jgi:hypothetical protein